MRINRLLGAIITCLCVTTTAALASKSFETSQWKTKNGAHVVFYPAMEVPMLDVSVAFAAGSAYDGTSYGLSALTARLLNEGNAGLDTNAIAQQLADTGAQYTNNNNQDMILVRLKTLTDPIPLKKACDLFATIISHPDFPESSFEREKSLQLMEISQSLESPDTVANHTFFQFLYQKHPYAHPVLGNKETVRQITHEQVRHFYHQFFVSRNATLVIVGAIPLATAKALAEKLVGDLPQGHTAPIIPEATPLKQEASIEVAFPSTQAVLRLGQLGMTHHDKDYMPLMVGNYILGGGALVSKLSHELRESRGLTYGVYSQFSPMPGKGPFIISLSTKKSQAQEAIELTRKTLTSFVQSPPSEEELLAAKRYITGSFPLSLASNSNIADVLLSVAFYKLPDDYLSTYIDRVNAISAKDIKQAFERHISPNALLQVTVGKKTGLRQHHP